MPSRGDVAPGDTPSLIDLGLDPRATMPQCGNLAPRASIVGGETEALEMLKKFAAECQTKPSKANKHGSHDSICGPIFSLHGMPFSSFRV
ncbi:hypothetical protein SLE2022_332460 [Rubroshorea leprosula]